MIGVPAASDPARIQYESRKWATVAHLSVFAFIFVPFGGLFASALIYSMRTEDLPLAREHQRRALNFCILIAVVNVLALFGYIPFLLSFLQSMAAFSSAPTVDGGPPPGFIHLFVTMFELLGCVALFFLTIITLAGIGAWRAWQGKTYGYLVSLPVIRPRA